MSTLPCEPGFRMDAFHVPSTIHGPASGVWYDAFRLLDGRIGITVGDLLGADHAGLPVVRRLQSELQTLTIRCPKPHAVLGAVDAVLRAEHPHLFVTAVVGVLDPDARTFTYASAGHHNPLLVDSTGGFVQDENTGLPLGLLHFEEPETTMLSLPCDSVLMLYTNGLVKPTRDIDQARTHLRAALCDPAIRTHTQPAQQVYERMRFARIEDDVAILTLCTDALTASENTPKRKTSIHEQSPLARSISYRFCSPIPF